jgi:hypothetical protein
LKRFDEQEGGSEPDRSSPVRVSTEHGRVRVSRPVVNTEFFSVDVHRPRVIFVIAREPTGFDQSKRAIEREEPREKEHSRSNTVITEELVFVEHSVKDTTKTILTSESEKTTISFTA